MLTDFQLCELAYQICDWKLTDREKLEEMLIFSGMLSKKWRKCATSDLSAVSYLKDICSNIINVKFEKSTESDEETQNGMDNFFRTWDKNESIPN